VQQVAQGIDRRQRGIDSDRVAGSSGLVETVSTGVGP
jgi:hypothetical protein